MESAHGLLRSVNKDDKRKLKRTNKEVKELKEKISELLQDATLKEEMMDIAMLKNERKIIKVKEELKNEIKNTVHLKECAEFNEKVFEEKECYSKSEVEKLTIKLQ